VIPALVGCDGCDDELDNLGQLQQLHTLIAMTYDTMINLNCSELVCKVMMFDKVFDSIKKVKFDKSKKTFLDALFNSNCCKYDSVAHIAS
jgi:hypothetical protein